MPALDCAQDRLQRASRLDCERTGFPLQPEADPSQPQADPPVEDFGACAGMTEGEQIDFQSKFFEPLSLLGEGASVAELFIISFFDQLID